MTIELEDTPEKRIAETKKAYDTEAEAILVRDLEEFKVAIESEQNFAILDRIKKALEWNIKPYLHKKDQESIQKRRQIGSYLAPLRERIKMIKPESMPVSTIMV